MVLKSATNTRLLVIMLLMLTLNACSLLSHKQDNNRSPNSPIIPVISSPTAPPAQQSQQAPVQTKGDASKVTPIIVTPKIAPSDVLASILDSAKKAISMQQWLRAQHQLEHALRIAPKDAQVFWLYAQVYEGLGVQKQEMNMLKRAKFLAKPKSDIYQLASQKLAQHEQNMQ